MKKFLAIILITFLYSSLSAQSYWTPKQEHEIDSIWLAIENLGTTSLPPLPLGRMWIGDVTGFPSSRAISGDFTITYLGVGSIGTGRVTSAMLAGSIDATKIGGGSVSSTEFNFLDGVTSNIQNQINSFVTGSGMLAKDLATKQTSTSEIAFTEDGIRYVANQTSYSGSNVRAGIPMYTSRPTLSAMYNGDIYGVGGQTDTDGSGLPLYSFDLIFLDQDYNRVRATFWDALKILRVIDQTLGYEYPEVVTATTDTLNFRMNNYIAARYTVPANTTIYISNSSPGWVSFCVNGTLNTVTISVKNNSGASIWGTIKWTNGIAPTFSNTYAVYQVNLQRLDADEILGSWVFHQ